MSIWAVFGRLVVGPNHVHVIFFIFKFDKRKNWGLKLLTSSEEVDVNYELSPKAYKETQTYKIQGRGTESMHLKRKMTTLQVLD